MAVLVTARGFADATVFGGSRTGGAWKQAPAGRPVRWRMVSDVPCERFGRLDRLSRHALMAAEMLGLPVPAPGPRTDYAICVGTQHGCISVDADFYRSISQPGGASPLLFTYTLPSSAMAEIAIRHSITGPNICLLAGPGSAAAALSEGIALIERADAAACVCVACDAVSTGAACSEVAEACFAAAFLLQSRDAARRHTNHPIAEIMVVAKDERGRKRNEEQPTGNKEQAVRDREQESGVSDHASRNAEAARSFYDFLAPGGSTRSWTTNGAHFRLIAERIGHHGFATEEQI